MSDSINGYIPDYEDPNLMEQPIDEPDKYKKKDHVIKDDALWEYTMHTRLIDYIPSVRKFWATADQLDIERIGIYKIEDAPPGLHYRITATPARSPIKNIQVFPFLPTAYLQLTGVPGGPLRMVERVIGRGFEIEEFTCVEKHNLPSTYHQGQFIVFVPTEMFKGLKSFGRYVYLTAAEMAEIKEHSTLWSVRRKMDK